MDDVKKNNKLPVDWNKGKKNLDFFELVRNIEQQNLRLPRVGKGHRIIEEAVCFGQEPYLQFPETTIASVSHRDHRILIFVYFMGLLGVNGPMPLEFTNYVFQRSHNHYDLTLRRFLDIINHRFISLFYRAWSMTEQAVNFDRPEDDFITLILRCLSGNIDYKKQLPQYLDACWGGVLGYNIKSKDGLELLLRRFLKIPLKIIDLQVSQYDIPRDYRARLSYVDVAVLGKNIQIGSRFFSKTRKFVIQIGPINFKECEFLLPGKNGFESIGALVNHYLDHPYHYDLHFLIYEKTIPNAFLNGTFCLGHNIWLSNRTKDEKKVKSLTIGISRLLKNKHVARNF